MSSESFENQETIENDILIKNSIDHEAGEITNNNENVDTISNYKLSVVSKPSSGPIDHLAISESLGYQIFRKTKRKAWNINEDNLLKNLVIKNFLKLKKLGKYTNEKIEIDEINWEAISNSITNRKSKDCKKRWVSSLNPRLKKGKWTQEEDELLTKAYKKFGSAWQKVATEIEGRNEDQCSKRYTEVLNTNTKDRLKPWVLEEDLKLIEGVKKFGTKWRTISNSINGRPSLTCRNRWRRIMTDIAKDNASEDIKKAIGILDKNGKPLIEFKDENNDCNENKNNDDIKGGDKHDHELGLESENKDGNENENENENESEIANASKKSNKIERPEGAKAELLDEIPNKKKRRLNEEINNENHYPNRNHHHKISKFSGSNKMHSPRLFSTNVNNSNTKFTPPTKSHTQWKYSFVDPNSNEEIESFSGSINSQELAHHLIDLARYNGVNVTIHQHIHHHYSPASPILDPQASVSRYSHFNYLPPLTEVPKLTSSSSPDNTVDSTNSNKLQNESNIMRLLNNNENSNNNNTDNIKDNEKAKNENLVSSRQQFASTQSYSVTPKSRSNLRASNNGDNSNTDNNHNNDKYLTEDLDEELDFWETMRSITQTKPNNNRPVSQHHPLHYYQPSNYKSSIPYQPSDSFGIQRFPNMSSPLPINISGLSSIENKNNVISNNSNNNLYITTEQDEDEDEEDEEMENIANQYGMYYSVFANKNGGGIANSGKRSSESSNGATGLVNSGYLMPFNPS